MIAQPGAIKTRSPISMSPIKLVSEFNCVNSPIFTPEVPEFIKQYGPISENRPDVNFPLIVDIGCLKYNIESLFVKILKGININDGIIRLIVFMILFGDFFVIFPASFLKFITN